MTKSSSGAERMTEERLRRERKISLTVSSRSQKVFAHLISSGFFKKIREQWKSHCSKEMNSPSSILDSPLIKAEPAMTGVTEQTTRELRR